MYLYTETKDGGWQKIDSVGLIPYFYVHFVLCRVEIVLKSESHKIQISKIIFFFSKLEICSDKMVFIFLDFNSYEKMQQHC